MPPSLRKKIREPIYNLMYKDGTKGATYSKRFAVTGITRDKPYDLTQGKKGSKVIYFSANPNGEAETVTIHLRQSGSIKKLKFDLDFAELLIKGRGVKGNLVTKYNVKKIELKESGVSTLKPRKLWFDDTVRRLNTDGRGDLLGEFRGEDRLLIITQKGIVKTVTPEVTLHFDADMIVLEKWSPQKPIAAIYWEGEKERYYVKRFVIEHSDREELFISDHPKSYLEIISTDYLPVVEIVYNKIRNKDQKPNDTIKLEEFIAVKGISALGNRLTTEKVKQINILDPIPRQEEQTATEDEITNESSDPKNNPEEATKNDSASNDNSDENPDPDDQGQTLLF